MESSAKPKLPNWLSFPVGHDAIAESIGDLEQSADLRIWYRDGPKLPRSEFERSDPFLVLRASHWRDAWMPDWLLEVYPVPRVVKHKIASLLAESVLMDIRRWLQATRPETWYETYKCISFFYDEGRNLLHCVERDNASIVCGDPNRSSA